MIEAVEAIRLEIEGPLDPNHYVFDFIALKHRTKDITDELDHRPTAFDLGGDPHGERARLRTRAVPRTGPDVADRPEVEARPGRKRVKRLSLLSGVERALTALCFLFSIFKARPSPFYL